MAPPAKYTDEDKAIVSRLVREQQIGGKPPPTSYDWEAVAARGFPHKSYTAKQCRAIWKSSVTSVYQKTKAKTKRDGLATALNGHSLPPPSALSGVHRGLGDFAVPPMPPLPRPDPLADPPAPTATYPAPIGPMPPANLVAVEATYAAPTQPPTAPPTQPPTAPPTQPPTVPLPAVRAAPGPMGPVPPANLAVPAPPMPANLAVVRTLPASPANLATAPTVPAQLYRGLGVLPPHQHYNGIPAASQPPGHFRPFPSAPPHPNSHVLIDNESPALATQTEPDVSLLVNHAVASACLNMTQVQLFQAQQQQQQQAEAAEARRREEAAEARRREEAAESRRREEAAAAESRRREEAAAAESRRREEAAEARRREEATEARAAELAELKAQLAAANEKAKAAETNANTTAELQALGNKVTNVQRAVDNQSTKLDEVNTQVKQSGFGERFVTADTSSHDVDALPATVHTPFRPDYAQNLPEEAFLPNTPAPRPHQLSFGDDEPTSPLPSNDNKENERPQKVKKAEGKRRAALWAAAEKEKAAAKARSKVSPGVLLQEGAKVKASVDAKKPRIFQRVRNMWIVETGSGANKHLCVKCSNPDAYNKAGPYCCALHAGWAEIAASEGVPILES